MNIAASDLPYCIFGKQHDDGGGPRSKSQTFEFDPPNHDSEQSPLPQMRRSFGTNSLCRYALNEGRLEFRPHSKVEIPVLKILRPTLFS